MTGVLALSASSKRKREGELSPTPRTLRSEAKAVEQSSEKGGAGEDGALMAFASPETEGEQGEKEGHDGRPRLLSYKMLLASQGPTGEGKGEAEDGDKAEAAKEDGDWGPGIVPETVHGTFVPESALTLVPESHVEDKDPSKHRLNRLLTKLNQMRTEQQQQLSQSSLKQERFHKAMAESLQELTEEVAALRKEQQEGGPGGRRQEDVMKVQVATMAAVLETAMKGAGPSEIAAAAGAAVDKTMRELAAPPQPMGGEKGARTERKGLAALQWIVAEEAQGLGHMNGSPQAPGEEGETAHGTPKVEGSGSKSTPQGQKKSTRQRAEGDKKYQDIILFKAQSIEEIWDELVKGSSGWHEGRNVSQAPFASYIKKHRGTSWRDPAKVSSDHWYRRTNVWKAIIVVGQEKGVSNRCSMRWFNKYQAKKGLAWVSVEDHIRQSNRESKKDGIPQAEALCTMLRKGGVDIDGPVSESDRRREDDISDAALCDEFVE